MDTETIKSLMMETAENIMKTADRLRENGIPLGTHDRSMVKLGMSLHLTRTMQEMRWFVEEGSIEDMEANFKQLKRISEIIS